MSRCSRRAKRGSRGTVCELAARRVLCHAADRPARQRLLSWVSSAILICRHRSLNHGSKFSLVTCNYHRTEDTYVYMGFLAGGWPLLAVGRLPCMTHVQHMPRCWPLVCPSLDPTRWWCLHLLHACAAMLRALQA